MANSARLGLTASLCQDLLPGGWIRPTLIKAVKLTYGSISTFFLFIVSHILLCYCEGWFNGVVAIMSASHTEGREFKPRCNLYIFVIYYNR